MEDQVRERDRILRILAEETFRPAPLRFPTRPVAARALNEIWTMDLAIMGADVTDPQFTALLVVVDVYSRYARGAPLKSKTGAEVLSALREICELIGAYPKKLWTDQGGEFYNRGMAKWCREHGIEQYSTYGPNKASIAERFIRTIKRRIAIERTMANTDAWIPVLKAAFDGYNDAVHSATGTTPRKVNAGLAIPSAKRRRYVIQPARFAPGDRVRISRQKRTFEKESGFGNWTREIFTVSRVLPTLPVTYEIKDDLGEVIRGSFYNQELQRTKQGDKLLVEQVLRTRKRRGRTESLVRWLGYGPAFDSWEVL